MRGIRQATGVAILLAALPVLAGNEAPPPGGQPRDFKLPAKTELTLDNGLTAVLVPYGTLPKVALSVKVRSGNLNENAHQTWLADLTSDLMREGTASQDGAALAAAFGDMGGELFLSTGSDITTAASDVLSEFGPAALGLLADVVRRPALPVSELERLKSDLVRSVSIATSQPQPLANARLAKVLYGDHPYGRMFPTAEMIQSYGIDDVRGFYAKNFGARRTRIYVVGVFDPKAMERAIHRSFGDWEAGPEPLLLPPVMQSRRAVHLVERPDAPQSTLRLGLPVVDPSHRDYTALLVTNTLLGGFFSSRVTTNIREDKGYTYSPSSDVATHYRSAHWVQNADVATEVSGAALGEILHEIRRLRQEPPTVAELAGVQNYMAGVFVLQNSSRFGIVSQLSFVDLHDLGDDYLTGYVRRVHSVTPQQVQQMAHKYLRADEMTIVAVGDRSRVEAQLAAYGPVVH